MFYFQVLTQLNSPATAEDVFQKAKAIAPEKVKNLQTVRAALAYLVRTDRAIRVGHGRYEAIKTNEEDIVKLATENQRLRERLRTLAKAFMVIIEANGYQLKDFEG
jgi:hypothetical protein